MKSKVQVIEKNEGAKIAWAQSSNKLVFGDDELAIRCDTRQRDYPTHVDVCADDDGNLVIGVGVGRYYVAQIDIPAIKYKETEIPAEETGKEADAGENSMNSGPQILREAQPIDMSEVVLTLWSVDDFRRTN